MHTAGSFYLVYWKHLKEAEMETASSINEERGKFREAAIDLIAGSLGNI